MDTERPPLTTFESLAGRIDHHLLDPQLSEDDVRDGCDLAARSGAACVIVRPSDIDIAVRALRGSPVKVGSAAGFPHGSPNTATKLYEVRDLIRRGAAEIDLVMNTGKLISRQFVYLETELIQAAGACRAEGILLKVVLECAYLSLEHKIIGVRLAKRAEVDFVSAATGFAPAAGVEDIALLYAKCAGRIAVKAAGGIESLDHAMACYLAGANRIGTSRTGAILDAWKSELAAKGPAAVSAS